MSDLRLAARAARRRGCSNAPGGRCRRLRSVFRTSAVRQGAYRRAAVPRGRPGCHRETVPNADFDLPISDGLTSPPLGGRRVRRVPISPPDLIASLGSAPRSPALCIDVSDLHNAAVILSGDPAVLYVGEDRFLPRLQSYLDLAEALRERVQQIDYVDLRFDDRIYVRPVGAPRSALARR